MSYNDKDVDMKDKNEGVKMEDDEENEPIEYNIVMEDNENYDDGRKRKRESSSDGEDAELPDRKKRKLAFKIEENSSDDNDVEMEDKEEKGKVTFVNGQNTERQMEPKSESDTESFRSIDSSPGKTGVDISADPRKFVVTFEVTGSGKDLHVILSTDRLKTSLKTKGGKSKKDGKKSSGGSQGDHVTAYRTFFQLVAAGIANQEPEEGIQSLCNIAYSYLLVKKNGKDETLEFLQKQCKQKLEKTMPRETRKKMTSKMRKSPSPFSFDEKMEIEPAKFSLKYTRTSILAKYMSKIATYIVQKTNEQKDMTFPKERTADVKVVSTPRDIKIAIKALASMERLLYIATLPTEDRLEELEEFNKMHGSEHYYVKGKEHFFKEYDAIVELTSYANEDAVKILKKIDQLSKKVIAQIVAFFMEVLYDYRRTSNTGQYKNDVNVLYRSSARHIVILFRSFKNIVNFVGKHKEYMCRYFLHSVFKRQGWKDHVLPDKMGDGVKNLTAEEYQTSVFKLLTEDKMSLRKTDSFFSNQENSTKQMEVNNV